MSILYTLSLVLSLVSLLTTVLTLIRFGSIQYAARQILAAQSRSRSGEEAGADVDSELEEETTTRSNGRSRRVRFVGVGAAGVGSFNWNSSWTFNSTPLSFLTSLFAPKVGKNMIVTSEGGVGFIDDADVARLPVNWIFRQPLFEKGLVPLSNLNFKLPTTAPSHRAKPLPPPASMAKLIMSRHAHRKPPRLPRRATAPAMSMSTASLQTAPSLPSRLVEQV